MEGSPVFPEMPSSALSAFYYHLPVKPAFCLMLEKFRYLLCGLAMGAADVVPGVSGGTIAYITGIYDQLLSAIRFDEIPSVLIRSTDVLPNLP